MDLKESSDYNQNVSVWFSEMIVKKCCLTTSFYLISQYRE